MCTWEETVYFSSTKRIFLSSALMCVASLYAKNNKLKWEVIVEKFTTVSLERERERESKTQRSSSISRHLFNSTGSFCLVGGQGIPTCACPHICTTHLCVMFVRPPLPPLHSPLSLLFTHIFDDYTLLQFFISFSHISLLTTQHCTPLFPALSTKTPVLHVCISFSHVFSVSAGGKHSPLRAAVSCPP